VFILARKGSIEELLNALAKACVIFFAFIAVSTEILSEFHLIDFPHLLGVWGLLCLSCVLAVAIMKRWRDIFSSLETCRGISALSILLLGAIAFILATTFATASLYPPNTWDSMTYHMARVANWINDNSVSFYPTAISRQNCQMPLAEFAILHLQLLSGSDQFANLVQWMCFFVTIALGALIAAELALNKGEQLISSVIIATIPMAILQSTSTQNDLVASSFILSFALFMLRLRKDFTMENIVFASLSLGLALLTKGTAFIYCAALGVSLAIPILFEARSNLVLLLRLTGSLSLVVLLALALNSGHFARSYHLYGTPISSGGISYWNKGLSTDALLSNIPRNLALHLGTPSPRLNGYIYRTFQLALGKQLNNPDTTWLGTSFSISYSRHEDMAGNPIHMLLALLSLAFIGARRQYSQRTWYAVGLLLGGCLYCLCFTWQPWASRLHTPLFALAAPVIAIALTQYAKRINRYIAVTAIVFMVLYSLLFALRNQTRPLLSQVWQQNDRMQLYFINRPNLYESYGRAMHILEKAEVQDVGLYVGSDDWEYPFWVFAKASSRFHANIRFRHVGVNDQSKILQTLTHLPAYVVATINTDTWQESKKYNLVYASENVRVLKKLGA
jgi:hypothetical protein